MSVANLPAKELRKSLPFQVRDALPLPVERSLLDFYPLEEPGDSPTVRGLLIAAPKEAVLTAVAGGRAGRPARRTGRPGLVRAAARRVPAGRAGRGDRRHRRPGHQRDRARRRRAADRADRAARRRRDHRDASPPGWTSTPAEAEALKCRFGLHGDGRPGHAPSVVRDAVRPLVNEIRSSFAYLTSGERQTQVTRLALSGGGALLPGLAEHAAAAARRRGRCTPTAGRLRDTRRARQRGFDSFVPSAAVSIGLTLGAAA